MTFIVGCPICAKDGATSKTYPIGSSGTLVPCSPYYDEDGIQHLHDFSATTWNFCCEKGHCWNVKTYEECSACGWRKGEDVVIVPDWQMP